MGEPAAKVYIVEERRPGESAWTPVMQRDPMKLFMFAARRLLWLLRGEEQEKGKLDQLRVRYRIATYVRKERKPRG